MNEKQIDSPWAEAMSIGSDTICAVSTPPGVGGIALVRVSGHKAIGICDSLWKGRRSLVDTAGHTAVYGTLLDSDGEELDRCLATVFRAPHSFTGLDTVEFSIHGSQYIQHALLKSLIVRGARLAEPGEFTRLAFLSGNIDLPEAEAVADMISSTSKAAHRLAISQLKGRFSSEIQNLSEQLLDLASLLELELDFSEEDVEFASRIRLEELARQILAAIDTLTSTFATADAIKNGVPVAIIGRPNAGKSTLLNALLNDDRAIVSDIPGTTRDTIEGTADINGAIFRFCDTAGLRSSDDEIEKIGIGKALDKISKTAIVLWTIPPEGAGEESLMQTLHEFQSSLSGDVTLLPVLTKTDRLGHGPARNTGAYSGCLNENESRIAMAIDRFIAANDRLKAIKTMPVTAISALEGKGLCELRKILYDISGAEKLGQASVAVTNIRHYQSLREASESLREMLEGIASGLTPDLLAFHLRRALDTLAALTGRITSETVLHSIFSRFCVGK